MSVYITLSPVHPNQSVLYRVFADSTLELWGAGIGIEVTKSRYHVNEVDIPYVDVSDFERQILRAGGARDVDRDQLKQLFIKWLISCRHTT